MVLSPARTYAYYQSDFESYRSTTNSWDGALQRGCSNQNFTFIDKLHVIKDNLFDVPPLFQLIQEQSGTDWKEMYQVFNMGHRMEMFVSESVASTLISISESFGVAAQIVGRVEASTKKKLTISSPYGKFKY